MAGNCDKFARGGNRGDRSGAEIKKSKVSPRPWSCPSRRRTSCAWRPRRRCRRRRVVVWEAQPPPQFRTSGARAMKTEGDEGGGREGEGTWHCACVRDYCFRPARRHPRKNCLHQELYRYFHSSTFFRLNDNTDTRRLVYGLTRTCGASCRRPSSTGQSTLATRAPTPI